ncbi:MAG TPA: nucleotide exchange factor GrpE [bacterium]|nr:nucleotide exchange factor GrpE [bacterium]
MELQNEKINNNIEEEKKVKEENNISETSVIEGTEKKEEETITIKKSEYDKLQTEAKENYDKMLRALAELDNYRKRVIKEKEQYLKFANEEIIKEILTIYDDFDRAFQYANDKTDSEKIEKIKEGINLIKEQIKKILEKNGVEEIKIVDNIFNPKYHQAIKVEEVDDESKNDKILEVYQKGYKMFEKVLKPAMVVVGKKKGS